MPWTLYADVLVVRNTVFNVGITDWIFKMISWGALKALDAETVLLTELDDVCESNEHERVENDCVVGSLHGYYTQHKASSTSIIQDPILDLPISLEETDWSNRLTWFTDKWSVLSIQHKIISQGKVCITKGLANSNWLKSEVSVLRNQSWIISRVYYFWI